MQAQARICPTCKDDHSADVDCLQYAQRQNEMLSQRNAQLEAVAEAANTQAATDRLALEAVAWYFDQRRYRVSPTGGGGYYLHDMQGARYPRLIPMHDGAHEWPSVYMALCRARQLAADREGGSNG